MTTHLAWCEPSRCSLPVHEGGAEAHRSAPIRFGRRREGYLYKIRGANSGWQPLHFITGDLDVAVADLRLLLGLIDELNARTYSPPEVAVPAMTAPYRGQMEPVYACRVMPTRHCPAVYAGVCGERPCARFESDDETPWRPEVAKVAAALLSPDEEA